MIRPVLCLIAGVVCLAPERRVETEEIDVRLMLEDVRLPSEQSPELSICITLHNTCAEEILVDRSQLTYLLGSRLRFWRISSKHVFTLVPDYPKPAQPMPLSNRLVRIPGGAKTRIDCVIPVMGDGFRERQEDAVSGSVPIGTLVNGEYVVDATECRLDITRGGVREPVLLDAYNRYWLVVRK